jgi:Ca2+-binding RTX toxin-like protein
MEFKFQQRFQTGSDRFDADLRDLAVVQTESGSWLYASNGMNGGLSLYRLDGSAAAPQLVQRYWHENASLGTGGISYSEIGGSLRLIQQASSSGALLSYEIGSNGNLARQQQQGLESGSTGGLEALVTVPVEAGQNGGHSLVYGINAAGELKGWQLDASGQSLGAVASSGASAAYHLPGHSALEISADGDLLFALDAMGQGVRSYRITTQTGALQAADSFGMAEGLPVSAPSALHSFQAYGASWLLLAASGTGSLSLLRVAADGSLDLRDQLNDTLATRFGGAAVLEVVQVGDHVLVLAAGADDGISLLRLLPSGQLLHVTSLAHAQGLGLENVTALETAVLGDQLEIYVTSDTAGGISRFSLDLSTLGVVRSLDQGTLWGSAGDDLLQGETGQPGAATGAVTLNGGAGDDILVASGAGSRLSGGAGADCFVVGPTAGVVTVTDFRPGTDQLDLSLFAGLYSSAQLQVDSLSGGMRLTFGDSQIVILRAGGGGLSLTDLWPDGRFATPDRITPTETPEQDIQYGGGTADQLGGGTGADRMQGLGGNDVLLGRGGNDELLGGDGNDTLRGGWGADTLEGELGDDMVLGGGGNDRLWGGPGRDDVQGHKGDDILWGGAGNDKLKGNAGVDLLYGGAGNDDLRGGTGDDRLWGEAGANLLIGQAGADSLFGGAANDTLKGGADADWAWGYDGDDTFRGGRGRDHLFGGNGNDSLSGDIGGDWLTGGAGADSFIFGRKHGRDVITDFTPEEDVIDLRAMGVAGDAFSDLAVSQQAGGVLVVTGNGEILLQGLELEAVTADDFLF